MIYGIITACFGEITRNGSAPMGIPSEGKLSLWPPQIINEYVHDLYIRVNKMQETYETDY